MVSDVGVVQKLIVSISVINLDIVGVIVKLFDFDGVEYLFYDQEGIGGVFGIIYLESTLFVVGDLMVWHGRNFQGDWIIQVIDAVFLDNMMDGVLSSWFVNVQMLFIKKIEVKGDFIVIGKLDVKG